MARFRYVAVDATGRRLTGFMEAASEADVIAALRQQGSLPVRAEPAGGAWRGLFEIPFGRKASLRRGDTCELINELAVMLGAGQDLDGALRFVAETGSGARVRTVASALRDLVRDGTPLAEAMARQRGSFQPIDIAMVRAGEASGRLAPALEHLGRLLDRQRALTSTVVTAMIYPALLLVASICAVTLMLTEVLPQFVPLFEQNGARLPDSTRFLIAAGDFLSDNGVLLLLGILLIVLAVNAALRRPAIRLAADRTLLRLPVIGRLAGEILAARFARTLGTLIGNGVSMVEALSITREAVGNAAARAVVDDAGLSVRRGGGLAVALEQAGVFPVRMVRLLRVGEDNARLAGMALRAAEVHEAYTNQGIQRLLALLVPVITVIMGAMVAGIVASLVLAMLSLNDLAT